MWETFVQTNTFNFVILVACLVVILKYAKVGDMISGLQQKIKKVVEESNRAKENSIKDLKNAKIKVGTVGSEIKAIEEEADLTALRLGRKIMADASIQVGVIENNADKIVDSEGKHIISTLSQKAALASVELAKRHIIRTLDKKPQYHAKFIEESINEIDRFDF